MLLRRIKVSLKHQDWLAVIIDFLIVVIGVFIGMQVANWNELRQLRTAELQVYQNLKEQISIDAKDIAGQVNFNSFYKSQYTLGIEIIENNDREKIAVLSEIVGQLTAYSDFDRPGNVYENMVNSGELRLIKNKQIIKGIISLEESMMYMNRMEAIHYEAMMSYAVAAAKEVIKFSTGEAVKPDELYGYQFQNLFFLFHKITEEKAVVYQQVLKNIDELNVLLEHELN